MGNQPTSNHIKLNIIHSATTAADEDDDEDDDEEDGGGDECAWLFLRPRLHNNKNETSYLHIREESSFNFLRDLKSPSNNIINCVEL